MKDSHHMEQFHKFLVAQGRGCEIQLLFWLAVEDLKSCISNSKVYSRKMGRIVKMFFKNTDANRGTKLAQPTVTHCLLRKLGSVSFAVLQCPDALAACLSALQGANPLQLLVAQSAVVEAMERQWYSRYIASLTVEEKKNEEETGEVEQKQTKKSPFCVEHTVHTHEYECMAKIL